MLQAVNTIFCGQSQLNSSRCYRCREASPTTLFFWRTRYLQSPRPFPNPQKCFDLKIRQSLFTVILNDLRLARYWAIGGRNFSPLQRKLLKSPFLNLTAQYDPSSPNQWFWAEKYPLLFPKILSTPPILFYWAKVEWGEHPIESDAFQNLHEGNLRPRKFLAGVLLSSI